MENNTLMNEAQLREQNRILTTLVHEMAVVLDNVLGTLPLEYRTVEEVKRAMDMTTKIITVLDAMPRGGVDVSAPPDYMSGRWKRRDGDIYGIVRQPGVRLTPEADNADHPPGDLRPSDQR